MGQRYFSPTSITEPNWELQATQPALAEFRPIAIRGATMLPPLPTSTLVVRWLEALWKEATEGPVISGIPIVGKDRVWSSDPPQDGSVRLIELRGKIDRVFQASSALCRKFESEALEIDFKENRLAAKREPLAAPLQDHDNPIRVMMRHKTEMALREIERQKELEHERKLAEIRASVVAPTPAGTVPNLEESVRFRTLDKYYQVIVFDNREYELKPIQSTVIRVLHKAYLEKRGSVGIKEIQTALGINSGKMSGWFRDKKNKYLYGTLIVQKTGSRNHYRLDL